MTTTGTQPLLKFNQYLTYMQDILNIYLINWLLNTTGFQPLLGLTPTGTQPLVIFKLTTNKQSHHFELTTIGN